MISLSSQMCHLQTETYVKTIQFLVTILREPAYNSYV